MEYTIAPLKRSTGTVSVTFTHNGVTYTRPVNACIREDDTHDIDATRARVAEVALGVARKIEIGVISSDEAPV